MELEKTIFTWNRSSLSTDSMITSQRSSSDRSGLGFGDLSLDRSVDTTLETNKNSASTSYRSIVFAKSTYIAKLIIQNSMIFANQITIPENNRSHTGLGF